MYYRLGKLLRPCPQANPHLKELYKKYSNHGFEIIGIACVNKNPGLQNSY